MFEVNKNQNSIAKLKQKTFAELNLKERENLQEWLAKMPNALGEELLIIQKEFDGFADTKERLDLLAIDKNGSLVVIENKLDDSGRDVVWQALKYVSYCSSLKTSEIINIFQSYLNSNSLNLNASNLICDFLEIKDVDEINLNAGSSQRMILVSANFRKEVTSTILWLISKGVDAQCMRVTPYSLDDKLFLDINQIIPTPEAQDYMIGMSSKSSEERETKTVIVKREKLRLKFWEQMLAHFRKNNLQLYQNINPTKDHWLNAGSGLRGCAFSIIFGKNETRTDIYISRASKDENKEIFDFFHSKKDEIELHFGDEFNWERLDDKKACRIKYSKYFEGYDEENWEDMISWIYNNIVKLEKSIKPIIAEYKPPSV